MPDLDASNGTFSSTGTAIADNTQFLRRCRLWVGDAAGDKGLDLSKLHIKFEVTSATVQTLKRLEARIYNLSDATANRIQQEFSLVELAVGYLGSSSPTPGYKGVNTYSPTMATIFRGTISYIRRGKENPTDKFLDIVAADGDQAYNWASVNISIPAESTLNDWMFELLKALQPFGITAGNIPDLDKLTPNVNSPCPSNGPCARGKALYGMLRDELRALANAANCYWSIDNNLLNLWPKTGYRSGGTIILSPLTGLIGSPTQTLDGVEARTLLNPLLQTGRLVRIDEQAITNTTVYPNRQQPNMQPAPLIPGLSKVNQYKVYYLRHTGDTRDNPWYSDLVCEAIDPSNNVGPTTPTYQQAIQGTGQ